MKSRYEAWLNDKALSSIDPVIYISDIAYQSPNLVRTSANIAGASGTHTSDTVFIGDTKISVSFAVRAYLTDERQRIVNAIVSWAINGGWLKLSDRPGQMIYVLPSRLPAVTSVMRWTDNLSIEFTAFDYPLWVDEQQQKVTLTNGETGSLYLPGEWKSYVEAEITAGAVITSFAISCDDTDMILDNLTVSDGDVIKVTYSARHHILSITNGSVSLLNKRSANSDDDLIAVPGKNVVSFSADGTATCTLKVRGVHL